MTKWPQNGPVTNMPIQRTNSKRAGEGYSSLKTVAGACGRMVSTADSSWTKNQQQNSQAVPNNR